MSENLKKISASKMISDAKAKFGILVGRVLRFKPVNTTFGTSLQLKGNFKLIVPPSPGNGNVEQEFESNICYVPGACETALEVAIADQDPAAFRGAEFAFKIFKRDNTKSVTGYEWAFTPIVAPNVNSDPLAHLLDAVSKNQLALPATTETVAETVSKKKK